MTTRTNTFDQNDPKYQAFFGLLHIRRAARIVAVFVNLCTVANLIFGLTRSSTVVVYTFFSFAFSIVVFGSMLYGVFKEKRLFLLPYLFFQTLSIAATVLTLLIFLISLAVHSNMVVDLAQDWAGIDTHESQEQLDSDLRVFTVWFIILLCVSTLIQAYFLELIYAFYCFLKDRENSFNFNFDTSFTNSAFGSETTTPNQMPSDSIN